MNSLRPPGWKADKNISKMKDREFTDSGDHSPKVLAHTEGKKLIG